MTEITSSIRTERRGDLARITLDQPRKLNAVDRKMATEIMRALTAWRNDDSVRRVVIDSSSERAFCAGGDIKIIQQLIVTEGPDVAHTAMTIPYEAMLMIASYPKPVITFMDGIAMGGGIGLGAHARHRVVTERSVLAMPENIIGLTPDAGGSWLLARAPSSLGLRFALTGERMSGPLAVSMGFADHLVSSGQLERLLDALSLCPENGERGVLQAHDTSTPTTLPLQAIAETYDFPGHISTHDGLETLLGRLRESQSKHDGAKHDWAARDIETLQQVCPFSLHVTWRMRQHLLGGPQAVPRTLEEAFALETIAVRHLIERPDFSEGVRARVIDKDNRPFWRPGSMSAVSSEEVERCFRPD